MNIGVFALCVISGFCLPALTSVNDDEEGAQCSAGCQPTIATRKGATCGQINVTVTVLAGHPGACECDPPPSCRTVAHCDIDLDFQFSVIPTLPGCVFDRPIGGQWGQTGYATTVFGCGAFGDSRIVGYSPTCNKNNITCSVTMDVYCTLCNGNCFN